MIEFTKKLSWSRLNVGVSSDESLAGFLAIFRGILEQEAIL